MTAHIRHRMPRKGGNSFYRDKTDYSRYAKTLCGADVTDRDVDYATGNTKRFRAFCVARWPICAACCAKQDEMQAAVIAALPDAFPGARRTVRGVEFCGDCGEDLSIGHRDGCVREHRPLPEDLQ